MEQQVILERDAELAALAAAIAAAEAGHGTLALVEGPAGIGKTTLLRAACRGPWGPGGPGGARVLTARGLALEQGFPYGIVRQLLDPVRGEDGLMDGAASLAARVFDWAEAGPVEDDVRYAAMHGLYWLVANLTARQPLVLAVDDAHWADAPSLRWLAHLAARVEHLPVALLLAVRDGPDEPELLGELRAAGTRIRLGPLGPDATAALVRRRLGAVPGDGVDGGVDGADAQLGRDWHASTGGNPFLLEALATALRDGDQKAEPIAQAVLRRIAPEGPEASRLTRALAVLGGPAPLRQAAALAGLDLPAAARLADRLRAADVLAPGSVLEFAHPIVRTAVYESIPPGERALAHAEAARLLERDGAQAERLALHLLRSEPGGDPRVAALLRAAAAAATGRGDPGAAAACLRRALDEPPPAADRPGLLLELGIALARERSPAAVPALREAVALVGPDAALLAARVLGIWAYHAEAAAICRNALVGAVPAELADNLQAELFQNAVISAETVAEAVTLPRRTGRSAAWVINDALLAATSADGGAITLPALDGVAPDSMGAVYMLLVLIWTGQLEAAGRICDAVLAGARRRGSMSMVAHASCLHSMIMRRLGRLEEAADAAQLALDFKLATSPPLAVAWAAALGVEALTRLGRLDEADAMADVAAGREPPEGWIHTLTFRQTRGALRVAQHRPDEALADLLAVGEGWQALGVTNPAVASWRTAAVAAYRALGQHGQAAALAAEQLALARKAGHSMTLGIALRAHGDLAEAIGVLEATPARYELALALADHGASLRRSGQRTQARQPLLRALDLAERTGAAGLAAEVKRELLAAGARPRRAALTGPDALTAGERRVAALAADGLSNRQIAEHLFVTQATVETHLRHAFRKLGITSRAELPGSLDIVTSVTAAPTASTAEPR
ncbi:MAG TPA: AAA family ATPase [Streptosporangiaceae bacterium]|nr:AAA family ATPase [Streptosporangiaceae bacterium]